MKAKSLETRSHEGYDSMYYGREKVHPELPVFAAFM